MTAVRLSLMKNAVHMTICSELNKTKLVRRKPMPTHILANVNVRRKVNQLKDKKCWLCSKGSLYVK